MANFGRPCVLGAICCLLAAPDRAHAGALPNAFQCYKVKDTLAKGTLSFSSFTNLPGFQPGVSDNGCAAQFPPKLACLTTIPVYGPLPAGGVFFYGEEQDNPVLCYKMKCPKNPRGTIDVTDETGVHSLTPKPASLLCVPACFANDQCCSGSCAANSCM